MYFFFSRQRPHTKVALVPVERRGEKRAGLTPQPPAAAIKASEPPIIKMASQSSRLAKRQRAHAQEELADVSGLAAQALDSELQYINEQLRRKNPGRSRRQAGPTNMCFKGGGVKMGAL